MTTRRYVNPPIQEAFCEFRFVPGQDWALTLPGHLQRELGTEYSGEVREQRRFQLGLRTDDSESSQMNYEEGLARLHLFSANKTRAIGIGPDVLSIHMLSPYQSQAADTGPGWPEFERRIGEAMEAYCVVANPMAIHRASVRYINKIVLPSGRTEGQVEVSDYVKCMLPRIKGVPEDYTAFMNRIEYSYGDGDYLTLVCGLLDVSRKSVSCILDLDVVRRISDSPINCEQGVQVARELHEREGTAFEAVITNKARELFDAD